MHLTYPFKQFHTSVVEVSTPFLVAGIGRVLAAYGDHGCAQHRRRTHRGRSMDDGESGMKEPPVIVKILLKRMGVCDRSHTILFVSKEDHLLLFVSLRHCSRTKVSISSHCIHTCGNGHGCHRVGTCVHVGEVRSSRSLIIRTPCKCHGRGGRRW